MALKSQVDKLEDLDEGLREHYKQGTDGKFYLETEHGDVGALVRAKDHEKNLRVAAERERDEAKGQVETITGERDTAIQERDAAKAEKGQDVAALEHSWEEKVNAEKKKRETETAALSGEIERLLVTNVAMSMAQEISTVPELFSDVIARRLKPEKGEDGKFFTRVLDNAGAPSATTLDELKQELLANEKYAAIVISGKGSGGGAGGSGSGGGAADKKWAEYSDAELSEMRRTDREKYDRLRKENGQTAPAT